MLRWLRTRIDRLVLRDKQFAFLFADIETDEAVSLDFETTGFDPWVDDIVSVAAIRVRGNRILTSEAYTAIVRPEARMRSEAIKTHQLRAQDVAQGRPIEEVLPELLHFIGSRPVVGYWIAFDVSMMNKYLLEMLNIRLPNRTVDVSALYYDRKYAKAQPGTTLDLRYASIMADLGLPPLRPHDAFDDALGAAEMYVILRDMRARGARIPVRRQAQDQVGFSVG